MRFEFRKTSFSHESMHRTSMKLMMLELDFEACLKLFSCWTWFSLILDSDMEICIIKDFITR